MKAFIVFITLIFLPAACTPAGKLVPTTIYVTPANPIRTLNTQVNPTPIPTPSVWQIWFRGYSCEGMELCGEGQQPISSSYFSIHSDGTGLRPEQVPALPTPQLPDGAPSLSDGFSSVPQVSPDKTTLVYGAKEDLIYGLYLVDIQTGQATKIYQTETIEDHIFWIGTPCWSADGQTIDFMLHSRAGMDNQPPVMFRINRDGSHLQELYTFPGLENAWFGNCSPDGQEIVLSLPGSPRNEENGLYLINRNTGQFKQILSGYSAVAVWPPQTEIP
jgi:Tol biopolymer transport system component